MNLLPNIFPLQANLAAPAGSFVRHRNYSYASSQELPTSTHQHGFRISEEDRQ